MRVDCWPRQMPFCSSSWSDNHVYKFQVADSLDNLLEDLSGLNRSIVNADPIPASPDKLKDDLEENKVRKIKHIIFSLLI